jgi:hypothetical protein
MSTNNNKQFLINQILWMGISFGISIAISILVPFPISLITIIGVFILLNFYMRNRMMRKMGIRGRTLLGSISSMSTFGGCSKILLYELRYTAQASSLS